MRFFAALFLLCIFSDAKAQRFFDHDQYLGVKAAYGYYNQWNYAGIGLSFDQLLRLEPDSGGRELIIGRKIFSAGAEMRIGGPEPLMTMWAGGEAHLAAFCISARAMRFTDFEKGNFYADLGIGFSFAGWVYVTGGYIIAPLGIDPFEVKGGRVTAGVNIPVYGLKKKRFWI